MTSLLGKWTYRSFHNNPVPVTDDAQTALGLFFAEAVFTFSEATDTKIGGAIDWQGGGLNLAGTVSQPGATSPLTIHMVGSGRPGTGTGGWEYDYHGSLAYEWPNGIGQVPALVGNVIRAKPHGAAQAGYVASFVAVKQP
jgi:hypothetical protein